MTKKVNTKEIGFLLKGIELLESHLNEPHTTVEADSTFKFNINIEHKIDPSKNILIVVTAVNIFIEKEKDIVGSIKTSVIYEIANLLDFLTDKGFELPQDLVTTLNSIALSTSRGMMFSQFRGTFLHNTFLPILDPKSFK